MGFSTNIYLLFYKYLLFFIGALAPFVLNIITNPFQKNKNKKTEKVEIEKSVPKLSVDIH